MAAQSNTRIERPAFSKRASWLLVVLVGTSLLAGAIVCVLPNRVLPIALAFPFALGLFALALVRFDLAVLLAVFLAPFVPPSIGVELSPSLPLLTIQRTLLAGLYVALALRVILRRFTSRLPHLSPGLMGVFALFVGGSVVSGLLTAFPLKAVYRILASLFDNIGLLVMIAYAGVGRKERSFVRRALLVLWISFTLLAVMGLVDTLVGFNPLSYLPAARGFIYKPVYRLGMRRAQGLLPNATALAIITAQGALLTMLIITWYRRGISRVGAWVVLLVHVAALAATVTRTAWLVFVVCAIIWLYLTRRISFRLIMVILGIVALLVIVGLGGMVYSVIVSGFDISQQNEVSTLLSRIRWATIVWANVKKDMARLLFGFGPGSVELLTTMWRDTDFPALMTSDYVIRLAEGGLVGLLSFVGILTGGAGQCRRLVGSSDSGIRDIGSFLFAAFLLMALGSLTLPIFGWAQTAYLFWILLGVVVVLRSTAELWFCESESASRSKMAGC